MDKFLIPILLLIGLACTSQNLNSKSSTLKSKNISTDTFDPPFDIQFQLESKSDHEYLLAASIELDSGTYLISPFSQDTFYLHTDIFFEGNDDLAIDEKLVELPSSIEEYDSIINTTVRFVRENTTYKKKLKVLNSNDFEVKGRVELLSEPSCLPYQVDFTLSHQSGELKVKKDKIRFPDYFK